MRHVPTLGLCAAAIAFIAPGPAPAQPAGLYFSQELGFHAADGLQLEGGADDRGSICDEWVNPFTDLMPAFCRDPEAPGTAWTSLFDPAGGVFAGAALGYRLRDEGRLRLELEYFFRRSAYDGRSPIEARGGGAVARLGGEVVAADDRVGDVTSHNVFVNLHIDFTNPSRLTPYAGFGAGYGFMRMDYGLLWVRNRDPGLITSIARYFPAGRLDDLRVVQQNLASTATSLQTGLADRLFGYQALFGLDYALSDSVSIGLKTRRTAFVELRALTGLDQLRGHPPGNRLDGSEPVAVTLSAGITALMSAGLNLTYRF